MNENKLKNFFLPKITPKFLIRLSAVALISYIFFGHVCIPMRINGSSMEPTYHDGGINFCWKAPLWFSKAKTGDVVMIRFSGQKIMLLKRIVAVEGETVEFKNGRLHVNGIEVDEPYIKYPCDWNLPVKTVEAGAIYVVGDNRNTFIEGHMFGQTSMKRIEGKPLW